MSREDPLKAEKDFTATLDEQFPQIDVLGASDYKSALDKLLLLEKQTRQSSDLASSKRVLLKIVQLLVANNDWELLNEQVTLLAKKHGQLKNAVQAMVQEVINHLETIAGNEKLTIATIENIRNVTENKIHVEVERARVSKKLSEIYFAKGDLDKAVEILCDLQVETYGLMELREKTEFILQQVQLTVLQKDFTQAKIISKKILVKTIAKFADLKIRYYKLAIEISLHAHEYLAVVTHYLAIVDILKAHPDLMPSATEYQQILVAIIYFVILSPYDNLQSDLINKIKVNPLFQKVTPHFELVKLFTTKELTRWPILQENFDTVLFASVTFDLKTAAGAQHYKDLKSRVIEHNLRVVSEYYSQISTKRLTTLLDLTESESEQFISDLVTKGIIYARINRPARIISFSKPKDQNDLLNDWCNDIDSLLDHVETIGHMITKEEMMNKIKVTGKA
ncbi:hypothetical protein BABINDRAFT_161619 [Babjeviella inositovora NRRL Y-12698]|uniref:PCI domain-containing protein n=1 Tax=Babjeviella inositovora NRRL Y-12698 TaxID=984486 RepID=A0A1E3QQI7_9ASCO|nr:uncharacterized protein BABINDRAFT_161619 [Babjeviella inositovora NRRL Y-12698]ODQ79956.1 hypothetical protein BABINDRAFT_161619 [Babjeviella inositovora NRRL Y-12698]